MPTSSTLCEHLGITKAAAVVGISGGGPTAVTMAGRHADLVERVILLPPWFNERPRRRRPA
jgi:pimeloyl-ACP methyl ester carboxylesterase